jgi:hypothetical protein
MAMEWQSHGDLLASRRISFKVRGAEVGPACGQMECARVVAVEDEAPFGQGHFASILGRTRSAHCQN